MNTLEQIKKALEDLERIQNEKLPETLVECLKDDNQTFLKWIDLLKLITNEVPSLVMGNTSSVLESFVAEMQAKVEASLNQFEAIIEDAKEEENEVCEWEERCNFIES